MTPVGEKILVVDDEVNTQALFQRILAKEGYQVEAVSSGEEALNLLETDSFALLITDLRMADLNGIELVRKAKMLSPSLPCIVLTAYGSIESAVTAVKEGAYDYLTKPADNEEIKLTVRKALEHHRLTREVDCLRSQLVVASEFSNMVGRSKPMRDLFRLIKLVANSHSTILIQGESGTGKELVARSIHQLSPRADRPFVAVDCGALPQTLLETELFGHVRGAFTGAVSQKKGLFEEAHGGTIFLDEIGDTTPAMQSKLLRVLQENEVRPVGSNKPIKVDVRVISATNKDLRQEVEKMNFRDDLYYRLAIVPIVLPPLRQRREDIPLLAQHFIERYCRLDGLKAKIMSAKALKTLLEHTWPGNVRELENVIERSVLLSPGPEISPDVLFQGPAADEKSQEPLRRARKQALENFEKEKIKDALQKARGKRTQAAKLLGISRATLYNKLKLYQLTH